MIVILFARGETAHLEATLVVAALASAASAGVALDDPAANVLASSPATLMQRRLLRIALCASVLALGWLIILLLVAMVTDGADVPIGSLTIEAAAFAALNLAMSAGLARLSGGLGGTAAGLALAPIVGCLAMLGYFHRDWPLPLVMPGGASHRWWWLIAGSAVVVLAASSDPARSQG